MAAVATTSPVILAFSRTEFAEDVVDALEVLAIVLIVLVVAVSFVVAIAALLRSGTGPALATFKRTFSRGLLVGLDVLIAADIIKSITVDQTLETAASLGLIVLVRIFLSWLLIVETEERWPWQPVPRPGRGAAARPDAAGSAGSTDG
jgi:uncharacterized membrane protein